jgi:molecular chaperone HtpG
LRIADRGRLLDLLVGHTIYNDATVAVRELLQNAIDAVRYQHYLEEKEYANTGRPASPMGKVIIKWDPAERLLIVEDNGIGMDRAVITSHLMKVGASFYNTPQFQQEYKDYSPISRFGIGILSRSRKSHMSMARNDIRQIE